MSEQMELTERQHITDRQREVLAWISHYTVTNGKKPTARQVCRAFASRWINGADSILAQLEGKGCVTWRERSQKQVPIQSSRIFRKTAKSMPEESAKPEPLTDRQQEVLTVIREHLRMYGPSVREIGKELGIFSPNGVLCHLKSLERKGYIRRSKKIARGIEVVS